MERVKSAGKLAKQNTTEREYSLKIDYVIVQKAGDSTGNESCQGANNKWNTVGIYKMYTVHKDQNLK